VRLDRIDGDEYTVIGVAEDGKYSEFEENPKPYFFRPMRPDEYGELCMAVRTTADPATLAAPIRKLLRDLNPNVSILGLLTLREHVRQALYGEQIAANLIATLGTLGLLLAAVGIFGLMSFVVRRRTQEIGIRLALGVTRSGIFRLVIRQALLLGAIGVVFGTIGAYASGNMLRTLLVGVAPTDVLAFAGGIIVLLAVTLLAAAVPALKATRVDPIVALRNE
ncbi:MAG TPA: FtsX-like permease family protein, partial [Candidatus Angelobacter sp.]